MISLPLLSSTYNINRRSLKNNENKEWIIILISQWTVQKVSSLGICMYPCNPNTVLMIHTLIVGVRREVEIDERVMGGGISSFFLSLLNPPFFSPCSSSMIPLLLPSVEPEQIRPFDLHLLPFIQYTYTSFGKEREWEEKEMSEEEEKRIKMVKCSMTKQWMIKGIEDKEAYYLHRYMMHRRTEKSWSHQGIPNIGQVLLLEERNYENAATRWIKKIGREKYLWIAISVDQSAMEFPVLWPISCI